MQDKFELIVQNAGEHMIVTDPDGLIIYANHAAEVLTGYTLPEMIGKRPSLWGAQMPKEFYENMWDIIKNKKQRFRGEITNKRKNGQLYTASADISPVLDVNGEIQFFVGIERDITAEKHATEVLEKAQESLTIERDKISLIISSMGEGLLTIDSEFRITMLNQAGENLLGINEKDILGKKWNEVVKTYKEGQETPVEERSFSRSIMEDKTIVTNLSDGHFYKTVSGRLFPIVSITAPIKSNGKIVGAVKVFRDATTDRESKEFVEREVTERTRQLSEEKAKLIASIESIVRAYVMVDTEGHVIQVNKQLTRFLGDPGGEWDLAKIQEKLGNSFNVNVAYNKVLDDRAPVVVKELMVGTKFFDIHVNPVFIGQNDLIGVLILIGDITEERVLQRSKDEFFSIASHELRTPLTAIRGNTAMIKQIYWDKLTDPDLKEMVDDINEASVRLIDIVNDFLNMGRLEQRKLVFKNEEVDIYSLISTAIEELETSASQKNLGLKFEDGHDLPKVYADPDRVKEVLVNIIGNSIKFTEKGEISVKASQNGGFVMVEIADTGMGIPIENQSLLFRKFTQAGSSLFTRDATKGTGLGLYISKLIVEGMGGSIWLEKSVVGVGSVFAFTLPCKKPLAEGAEKL